MKLRKPNNLEDKQNSGSTKRTKMEYIYIELDENFT